MRTALRVAALVGSAVGCNTVLGIESATFDPPHVGDAATADANLGEPPLRERDADTATDVDAGPCVDTMTNPRHCGACGHDCGPGACKAGVCERGVVVEEPGLDNELAIGGGFVFYRTFGGLLRRVPIAGGPATTLYEDLIHLIPQGIAVVGSHVYFIIKAPPERIARCPVNGPCTPETVASGISGLAYLAASGGKLFVSNAKLGTRIYECAPPCSEPRVFATDVDITAIATSDSVVAWSTGDDPPYKVRALDASGTGSPRTVFESTTERPVVAVRARTIYVAAGGGLFALPFDAEAQSLLGTIGEVNAFAVTSDEIYHSDDSARLFRRALSAPASEPSVLEREERGGIDAIVDDPTGLYWTSGRQVMRRVR